MSQRLGDLLVKEKIITPEQLQQATKVQKETSCRLGSALVKLNFLTDEDVTNFLSRQYGVPAINLSYFEIDASVVKLIPYETAKRYQILPLSRVGASLTIAMVDPTNVFAMDDIKFMTGFNIEPVVASEASILEGIEKAYGTTKEQDLDQAMERVGRVSVTRQRKPAFRADQACFRVAITGEVRKSNPEAIWNGAGNGTKRIRQDEHTLLFDRTFEYARYKHHVRRSPGRIPIAGRKSSADERADRVELCCCPARFPSARPQHHSRR